MNRSRFVRSFGLLVIGVSLAACSSASPSATSSPSPAGTPQGNPLPAQLQGDWTLSADAAGAIASGSCSQPYTTATCMFKLTLTASKYIFTTNVPGFSGGGGDVVANGGRLMFFNGAQCGMVPPAGVGAYTWAVNGSTLHLTSVNSDPCPREPFLANQNYIRSGG